MLTIKKSKPKKNRAERKEAAKIRRDAAPLMGLLYKDLLHLIIQRLRIQDVLNLAQTCRHFYLNTQIRSFISSTKPKMKWKDGTESPEKEKRRLAFQGK